MLQVLGLGPNSEIARTVNKYTDQKERIKKQIADFIKWKQQYPFNGAGGGTPGYGDNDKKFKTTGNFGTRLPGISHAHLTHNLSIVYRIDRENETLNLYGVYSHDDIGTGNPPNVQRQQQMSTRWTNMNLTGGDTSAINPAVKTSQAPIKQSTGKPDYTPKQKIAVQPAQQQTTNPLTQLARSTDSKWPQRNLYNQLANMKSKQDQLALINKEAQYLNLIRQRGNLYPNQIEYMRGLQAIFNQLTQR